MTDQNTLNLKEIVSKVEADLATVYDFTPAVFAHNHLIETSNVALNQRASLLLNTVASDEVEVGIYFSKDIEQRLSEHNPITALSNHNLDSFCVVIEEISHFHLVVNRLLSNRPISQLELEWQAEIDKVLLCAINLHEQSGDPHYHHLMRSIFENATYSTDQLHYVEASKLAARFWYDILSYVDGIGDPLNSPSLQKILRENYRSHDRHLFSSRIPRAA